MLKQQELNLALEHQERWKKEYQNVLAKFLARTGVNLTEYTFDDESGVLSRIKKE